MTTLLDSPAAPSLEAAARKGWHTRELGTAWADLQRAILEVARLQRHPFDGRLARAVDAVGHALASMQGLDEYGRTPAEAKAARAALATRLPRTEGEEDNQEPEDES
jgi:hypothetical protein